MKSNLGSYITMTTLAHKFHSPAVLAACLFGAGAIMVGTPIFFITRAHYRKKIKEIEKKKNAIMFLENS